MAAAPASDSLVYMVDQGGGSFTAYLFAPGAKELGKIKSSKDPSLIDKTLLAKFKTATSIDLYNNEDGTFNDFAEIDPKHYPLLAEILSAAYEAALRSLQAKLGDSRHIKSKICRQTGKIRARLMQQENKAHKQEYERTLQQALGAEWDYRLLANKDEAEQECGAFFTLNNGKTNASVIGLGIGSSSTQGYALDATKKFISAFDTACGAKPTAEQKKNGKQPQEFTEQFKTILGKLIHGDKLTLVCLNAIGYTLLPMCKCTGLPEKFCTLLRAGEGMPPQFFFECAEKFAAEKPGDYGASLLLGLATAVQSFAQIETIILERKKDMGDPLPFETSWIRYTVSAQEGR